MSGDDMRAEENEKTRLLDEIRRAKAEAEAVKQFGSLISRTAQTVIDYSTHIETALMHGIYNGNTLGNEIIVFGQAADSASQLNKATATQINSYSVAASGVTNTTLNYFSDPVVVTSARNTSQSKIIRGGARTSERHQATVSGIADNRTGPHADLGSTRPAKAPNRR